MSHWRGKRVLLTGAGGFIGRHVLARLRAEKKIDLWVVRRQPDDAPANERTLVADLADIRWASAFNLPTFDVVLHLAGFIPKSAQSRVSVAEVYRDNLAATYNLLAAICSDQVTFTSTVDVYPPKDSSLTETAESAPTTLYGVAKLFVEQMVRDWTAICGCRYAILRLGHIYGPGEEAYAKLIPEVIRSLKRGETPTLTGGGTALRDYLYVDDAVEAILRAALHAESIDPLNIVRGESVRIVDVVDILCRLAGGPCPRLIEGAPARSLTFDASRLHAVLGDWQHVPLAEGLRREWDSFIHV